jgi:hypothetical protein
VRIGRRNKKYAWNSPDFNNDSASLPPRLPALTPYFIHIDSLVKNSRVLLKGYSPPPTYCLLLLLPLFSYKNDVEHSLLPRYAFCTLLNTKDSFCFFMVRVKLEKKREA